MKLLFAGTLLLFAAWVIMTGVQGIREKRMHKPGRPNEFVTGGEAFFSVTSLRNSPESRRYCVWCPQIPKSVPLMLPADGGSDNKGQTLFDAIYNGGNLVNQLLNPLPVPDLPRPRTADYEL